MGRRFYFNRKGILNEKTNQRKGLFLIAENGFRAITRKDICESCGLSRGGLYRHYESTRRIFEEILNDLSGADENFIRGSIEKQEPARRILKTELNRMQAEMPDGRASLSYAIYEYSLLCEDHVMAAWNRKGKEKWRVLPAYGIERGEFKPVAVDPMVETILYAYIVDKIRKDLERKDL